MNNTAAVPGREPLAGLVERVTYHNPDNGYCVLRVKVRGHRDLVTVLGHAASISDSMSAELYPTYDTEERDSEIRVVIDAGSFIELLDLSDLLEEGGGDWSNLIKFEDLEPPYYGWSGFDAEAGCESFRDDADEFLDQLPVSTADGQGHRLVRLN